MDILRTIELEDTETGDKITMLIKVIMQGAECVAVESIGVGGRPPQLLAVLEHWCKTEKPLEGDYLELDFIDGVYDCAENYDSCDYTARCISNIWQ